MRSIYPWYDSVWLTHFVKSRELIGRIRPEKLQEFDRALEPLRTRADFRPRHFSRVFGEALMGQVKQVIRNLQHERVERHEVSHFGRHVVHDEPFITQLQHAAIPLVSQAVGEPVEVSYNFLSMYSKMGVCPVHMDAPEAKYTLDLCVEQSEPWPIYFSNVRPWPEQLRFRPDWHDAIKNDPHNQFTAHALRPGEALLFSGSSQWHYRDPHPSPTGFCHLVFLHYVPKGMLEYSQTKRWPKLFGVPELAAIVGAEQHAAAR
jgi:hypothetical protein